MIFAALFGAALAASPSLELTFAAKTRPAGGAVIGGLMWDVEGVDVGPSLGVYFFWYELDAAVRKVWLGGLFVTSAWVGVEPGWFIPSDDAARRRTFGMRGLARTRLEINLRNDWVWLYSRTTPLVRLRQFEEYDPFRDQILNTEWAIEQSVALMGSPVHRDDRRLWIYAEITLEAEKTVGWLDILPRGGILVENLVPHLSFDLDVYYSLMDNKLGGLGGLLVVWWNPPLGKRASAIED